jgi:hypothetical protein
MPATFGGGNPRRTTRWPAGCSLRWQFVYNGTENIEYRISRERRKSMAATERRYSKEEFARRGDAIYEKHIRPVLTSADKGKFVAIDIESGEYAIDADELKACRKLRARIPDAQIWMVRVGYRSVHRFGGREEREAP